LLSTHAWKWSSLVLLLIGCVVVMTSTFLSDLLTLTICVLTVLSRRLTVVGSTLKVFVPLFFPAFSLGLSFHGQTFPNS
jgi:hypothetical protein